MKNNVTVINWSGLNYGDIEIFSLIYDKYIKDTFDKVYLFADSDIPVKENEKIEFVDRVFGTKKDWIKCIKRIKDSSKVFVGGGDIIRGESGTLLLLFIAALLKKDIIIAGVGVSDIDSNKKLVSKVKGKIRRYIFNRAKFISVRDEKSFNMVKRYTSNSQVHRDVDLVFLYDIYDDKNYEVDEKNYIAVSVIPPSSMYKNNWDKNMHLEIAKALDEIYEKYNIYPVFLPGTLNRELKEISSDIKGDDAIAENIIKHMKYGEKAKSLDYIPSYKEAKEIIRNGKGFVGFRLHYIISSILNRKKMVAFNYSQKIREVLKTIGLEKYCIEISDIKKEILVDQIEKNIVKSGSKVEEINSGFNKIKDIIFNLDKNLKKYLQ